MGAPGKTSSSARIRCIDWLRGFAVFDMIMWHTGMLLDPVHAKDPMHGWLGFLAGLVAPSFMFAAGFAIALVMIRASADPAARRRRAFKSLQRIAEVLAIAFVLKCFLRTSESWWVVKIDILSCIALSLLLAWPLQLLLAPRPRLAAAVCAVLAVASFAVAPLIPPGGWGVFIAPHSSDFPPIPWAGYVFLGSTAGALASMGVRPAAVGLGGVVALGALFRFGLPLWNALYANAWEIGNAGERCILFGLIALAFMAIEQRALDRGWTLSWPPFSLLELVGTNALTAYVAHITLLFIALPPVRLLQWLHLPIFGFSYMKYWGARSHWTQYWILLATLWTATVLVCWGWPKLEAWASPKLPWKKPAPPPAPRPA